MKVRPFGCQSAFHEIYFLVMALKRASSPTNKLAFVEVYAEVFGRATAGDDIQTTVTIEVA
jgi:hypothetical protein